MFRTIVTTASALWLASLVVTGTPAQAPQTAATGPDFRSAMTHHFADVVRVHDALVRGDLAAVREPARALGALEMPADMPEAAAPFVEAIRRAGQRAAESDGLALAAAASATMLTTCGGCHVTLGAAIAPRYTPTSAVEDLNSAMLEHQRSMDEMLQGLFVPAPSQWRQGAESLGDILFESAMLPHDLAVTAPARGAQARVRELAEVARPLTNPTEQAAIYTQLVTTCAECHVAAER